MKDNEKMKNRVQSQLPETRHLLWLLAIVSIIGALFFISTQVKTPNSSILCTLTGTPLPPEQQYTQTEQTTATTPLQLRAILHYATSNIVPQQSLAEITVSFNVLKSLDSIDRPANFLVFGLGHDSLMWASLNPRGTTLFLEEDPKWSSTVLAAVPDLRAHTVEYRTHLREADELLEHFRSEPACSPVTATLRGNEKCRLALHNLPDEVYETEWDLVMIDAPRGYFPAAPGRMAAIYSAAVMARDRKGPGVTHVFLHDVDRRVEKLYAEELLCKKNLVEGVGRIWHFQIPPNASRGGGDAGFC